MLATVYTYIIKRQLLEKGKPTIVGLSGGADSVALLAALVELGYPCIAAHCNFHLRGEESDRDEHFAATFAQTLGVPFFKVGFDTRQYASEHHLSIEMAARELRYHWFEELRGQENAQAVAVAHHKDDNAETLLLNLVRGTGIRGVRGIRPANGYVVRPLLCVSKGTILAWLAERGLPFVTDSSNFSEAYTRNFIRLRVLPLLEELNPSVKYTLARTAEHLSAAELIYQSVISEAREKVLEDGCRLDIKALFRFPAPGTVLYELLLPYHFSRQVSEDAFSALDKEPGKLFYSPTHRLATARGYLLITPLDGALPQTYTIGEDTHFLDCGNAKFFISKVNINEMPALPKSKQTACLDYNKLKFPLTVRPWKAGDWFIPFGMTGRKKLSDFFTNLKYSKTDKENAWIICSGEDIAWVAGERIDNRYKIQNTTQTALCISIENCFVATK